MKEVTYGWYPSANDIYKPKGRPSSYHLECLYKYGDSLYYQGQVAPPEPELFVRGVSSATPPSTPGDLRKKARSVPVPKFSHVPKLHIPTPIQCWSTHKTLPETQWGVVDDLTPQSPAIHSEVSWPLPQGKQQQQRQQHQKYLQQKHQQQQLLKQHIQQQQEKYFAERHQSPQYAWGFRTSNQDQMTPRSDTSSVELAWPVAHNIQPVRPQSSYSGKLSDRQEKKQAGQKPRPASSPVRSSSQGQKTTKPGIVPSPPRGKNVSSSKRPSRIQSATVRRDKTPLPSRPVTAGPGSGRQSVQEQPQFEPQPIEVTKPPSRPTVPVPFVYDVNDTACELEPAIEVEQPRPVSPTSDEYERILDKYGWRAEIHGDPYGLKKPKKRISYAVKCPEPDLLPEPPGVHMETNEPFFYNTIPCRPMSFAVDKEWMSEVLLAKRLELQKREGGIKYNYKNFAFVY